jgi:quercetin dioxygenase-like cupin family protein
MDISDQSGSTSILNKEYEIKKGDIVRVPAGLIHWHGAIKGEDFSHIAIRKKTNIENIWL